MITVCPKCGAKFEQMVVTVPTPNREIVCPKCVKLLYIPEEPNQMKEKNFV
jgi:DNA-directed RNA polymerase subunit RPC12/RpoP